MTNWERFRAKTAAYLKQHEDHVALQRLRRNKQLTPEDLEALEGMLAASGASAVDVERAKQESAGLGLFIRSLIGLDRQSALDAFEKYLDDTHFDVNQIRFVTLIVDELTANGVMDPARLFESPITDNAKEVAYFLFLDNDVQVIADILTSVRASAVAESSVA